MARKTRTHILTDDMPEPANSPLAPTHLKKQSFGRRLYHLMLERGWHQSELARRAGIPRDAVSIYVRGKSFPTPKNLAALALAFGMKETDLLPNHVESAIDEDNPAFDLKVSPSAPTVAWIRANRLVSLATAVRIAEL